MQPLKIAVHLPDRYALTQAEVAYTLDTLAMTCGIPWKTAGPSEKPDVYFGLEPSDARLVIRPDRAVLRERFEQPMSHKTEERTCFFYFGPEAAAGPVLRREAGRLEITNDILLSAFYLLSGREENFLPRQKHDFHDLSASYRWKHRLLHTPAVNQYAGLLRSAFAATHSFEPLWPQNRSHAFLMTHDVDYPEIIGWIEAVRYLAQKGADWNAALQILRGKESFWQFDAWLELENAYGIPSAFYFCAVHSNLIRFVLKAPDPFYDVRSKKFRDLFARLKAAGREVGIHSSYLAYRSEAQFLKEKTIIEQSLGDRVVGNRHHFWHLNQHCPTETMSIHHRIGLEYDSSMSFEKHSGFRRGICTPFYLFSVQDQRPVPILQLPPTLMDTHLTRYDAYDPFGDPHRQIDSAAEAVKSQNGLFIANFHENVLNETLYPGRGALARYLIERMVGADCFVGTPAEVAAHWRRREACVRAGVP